MQKRGGGVGGLRGCVRRSCCMIVVLDVLVAAATTQNPVSCDESAPTKQYTAACMFICTLMWLSLVVDVHRVCLCVHGCDCAAQALLESPDAQAADTAGLQLAAALGFAVYGFKEWKRLPLGERAGRCGGVGVGWGGVEGCCTHIPLKLLCQTV